MSPAEHVGSSPGPRAGKPGDGGGGRNLPNRSPAEGGVRHVPDPGHGGAGRPRRLAGKRQSGSWATQAWLVSEPTRTLESGRLIPDTADARNLFAKLGSEPRHVKGDMFEAKDRPNVPERAKPTLAKSGGPGHKTSRRPRPPGTPAERGESPGRGREAVMPRATRWDVVVVGGANTDFLVRVLTCRRPDKRSRGTSSQEAPGGRGPTRRWPRPGSGPDRFGGPRRPGPARGRVGRPGGRRRGRSLGHLASDPDAPTGAAVIHVGLRDGQKQIMTAPGANSPADRGRRPGRGRHHPGGGRRVGPVGSPGRGGSRGPGDRAGGRGPGGPRPGPGPAAARRGDPPGRRNPAELEGGGGRTGMPSATGRRPGGPPSGCWPAGRGRPAFKPAGRRAARWPGGEAWLPRLPVVETVDATGAGGRRSPPPWRPNSPRGPAGGSAGRFASAARGAGDDGLLGCKADSRGGTKCKPCLPGSVPGSQT